MTVSTKIQKREPVTLETLVAVIHETCAYFMSDEFINLESGDRNIQRRIKIREMKEAFGQAVVDKSLTSETPETLKQIADNLFSELKEAAIINRGVPADKILSSIALIEAAGIMTHLCNFVKRY